MKKLMMLLLVLIMIFSLAACDSENGSTTPSKSSAPTESSKTSPAEGTEETMAALGLGETGEANGLAITVDKITKPGSNMLYTKPKDGFEYLMVWYTFENWSKETIETPRNTKIYIVYEEGATGSDCDMTSDDAEAGFLEGKKKDKYNSHTELAPGETTSGWLIYQKPVDMKEITIHYYSELINVPPDLVFRFADA
jgi:predicted small lipoprotein YifL